MKGEWINLDDLHEEFHLLFNKYKTWHLFGGKIQPSRQGLGLISLWNIDTTKRSWVHDERKERRWEIQRERENEWTRSSVSKADNTALLINDAEDKELRWVKHLFHFDVFIVEVMVFEITDGHFHWLEIHTWWCPNFCLYILAPKK